jgi:hypothetical protein
MNLAFSFHSVVKAGVVRSFLLNLSCQYSKKKGAPGFLHHGTPLIADYC